MTADTCQSMSNMCTCVSSVNSLCESTTSVNVISRSWPLYAASVASETFPRASSCHVSEFPATTNQQQRITISR